MEPYTTKAGSTDGPILSIRPLANLVYDTFKGLQQKVEEVRNLAWTGKPFLSVLTLTLFVRWLQSEFLNFCGTLAELTDNNYREVEEDWTVAERAVESRCVSEYTKYSSILTCILQELKSITKSLDLTEGLQSDQIGDLVSSDDRWARLLQALCTLGGSAGGALQISFTRIEQANDKLVQIRRLSQKDPSADFFKNLVTLRDHASSAADILGTESVFGCQCPKSHQVYLRAKECFKRGKSESGSQPWHQACSLLFHNPSPRHRQWEQVDMEVHIEKATMSKTPEQKSRGEITSSKIEEKLGKKKTQKAKKKKKKRRPPAQPPPITTDPSDGLCAFLNGIIGAGQKYPVNITICRQDLSQKLLLRSSEERTEPSVGWANPLPLCRRPEGIRRLDLSTEQKLRLAHKVAFSLFYLFSTPWIQNNWTSEDVYLTWQESSVGIVYPVFSLTAAVSGASVHVSGIQESLRPRIPFIYYLGRFLVELWCGTLWSHIRKAFLAGDGPSGVVDADTFIFTRLLNWNSDSKISDKDKPFQLEGGSYFMAVQKCFMCDFNPGQPDWGSPLDNDDLARWIYRHVLRPLEYALEDFQTRQDRLFGTRLDLSPEKNTPRSDRDTRRLRLFANEEIVGDRKKKEDAADDWFYRYGEVKKLVRDIGRERPDKPTDRIRVAILDTGVDVTHYDLHSPWIEGQIAFQNFVGTRSDIPQDDDGHGTHVTSILLQMAENVDIYVARVSADGLNWKSSEVEDAIRWATDDKQVHIISISFGFPNADQSLESIRRALLEAHAADVLIFAATGNKGRGNAISFPACLDEVISVASTDGNHKLSDFVPRLGVGKRLCAIGEAIEAAWIDKKGSTLAAHSSTERKAGTSYATPVVAGVAAMVMDLIWSDKEDFEYQCRTLRTNRGMLAVLELMIERDRENKAECLQPWKFFNKMDFQSISQGRRSHVEMRAAGLTLLIKALLNIYR